jgi:hypothetical protein
MVSYLQVVSEASAFAICYSGLKPEPHLDATNLALFLTQYEKLSVMKQREDALRRLIDVPHCVVSAMSDFALAAKVRFGELPRYAG